MDRWRDDGDGDGDETSTCKVPGIVAAIDETGGA